MQVIQYFENVKKKFEKRKKERPEIEKKFEKRKEI